MTIIRKDRKTVIGILGGGQLARMSAMQAIRMGFDVAILEKQKNSPAGILTKNEFVGWVDDQKVFDNFIAASDVITLENEFIDFKYLQYIESKRKKVIPSSYTVSLIQDKLVQKSTFQNAGIPVPKFLNVEENISYKKIREILGKKFILKSRKMGYDGYGNVTVRSEKDFVEGMKKLTSRHSEIYAEEFIPFIRELAVMIVRTKKEIITYPVVETIQKNHICHTVIAPASIDKKTQNYINQIAVAALKSIRGFGIYGIELFHLKDGQIMVNEIAPRPHNTGHYTIESCTTSQFENHIRSVLDLPLGNTDMVKPYAVMINLLGKRNGKGVLQNYHTALENRDIHLHIYGKEESRIGRKMGHITLLGDNIKKIISRAKEIEKKIII